MRSISVNQIKGLSNASKSSIRHLIACGYQYDTESGEWSRGRLKFEEWRVTETVILYLRENYPEITEKGVFASEIIEEAKHTPQITVTKGFIERCKETFGIGHRISGKAIFAFWCAETGITTEDDFTLFMKQKSLVVNKFYDRLSMVCRWLGRKRINGAAKWNVFIFGEEPIVPDVQVARRSDPVVGLQDLTAAPLIRPAG